jgi:hypothetical protein
MFDDIKKEFEDLQKQMNALGSISDKIKAASKNIKGSEGHIIGEMGEYFQTALKEAQQGKPVDFNKFIIQLENLSNGNQSSSN